MQRKLLLSLAAVILGILFIQLRIIDAVLWFLLAGLVPGTNYSIPPLFMLVAYTLAGVFILVWLHQRDLKTLKKRKTATKPARVKKASKQKIVKAKQNSTAGTKRKKYAKSGTA